MQESSPFFGATTNHWGEFLDVPIKDETSSAGAGAGASKFKGVVHQPNGHWGAQIYANHQRIWLGTYKSEREAAMAYDSAAMKLRDGNRNRNMEWNDMTGHEASFQDEMSAERVVAMIKDGSYGSKLRDFVRAQEMRHLQDPPSECRLRQLFQKVLTPSDVGKLNRLVIPKKHALKHLPRMGDGDDAVELTFFEQSMRSWNFRYCYWKSSQSYVFTRGWNRFTREKELRSNDRVIFSSYAHKMYIQDVKQYGTNHHQSHEKVQTTTTTRVTNISSKAFRLFGVQML